jgi:hypothetical protein
MLKFALAIGICFEWLTGPAVGSVAEFGQAATRTVMATLAAWMVLEALRAVLRVIDTLDERV